MKFFGNFTYAYNVSVFSYHPSPTNPFPTLMSFFGIALWPTNVIVFVLPLILAFLGKAVFSSADFRIILLSERSFIYKPHDL